MALKLYWPFKVLLMLALYLMMILIDMVIEAPLFNATVDWLKSFPSDWPDSALTTFFKLYTNVSVGIVAAFIGIYVLLDGPKIKQILFFDSVLATAGLIVFAKNAYHAGRPGWDKDVRLVIELSDYGNPSGHSGNTAAFMLSALIIYWLGASDLDHDESNKLHSNNSKYSYWESMSVKIAITALAFIILGLVMFSRVYLGAHGIDQVIYGFAIGMITPFIFLVLFREELVGMYKTILTSPKALAHSLLTIILCTIFLIGNTALYILLLESGVRVNKEIVEHIKEKYSDFTETMPLEQGLFHFGFFCTVIGMHGGLLFSTRYLANYAEMCSKPVVWWRTKIFRLCALILLAGLIPGCLILSLPREPVLLLAFLKTAIPSALAGFLYFGLGDYVTVKLGLIAKAVEDHRQIDSMQLSEVIVKD